MFGARSTALVSAERSLPIALSTFCKACGGSFQHSFTIPGETVSVLATLPEPLVLHSRSIGQAHLIWTFRTFASGPGPPVTRQTPARSDIQLYRGPWLLTFRLLVRFKIAQLGCVAALCVPVHSLLTQGTVGGPELWVTSLLFTGCAIVSTTLFFFSRRYVGELSLHSQGLQSRLRISTLDFWGNRQDTLVSLEDIVPPLNCSAAQAAQLARQSFIPLQIEGDRSAYFGIFA
ncbi:hypothetical protein WJX73_004302 [Symbiochloris irregularis]|uniref:Transmembrane protein 186 n=1 Tax=Symbiochloris irregularis TaxID=706552 RepID=A0AAW1P5L1_9CHLO